MLLNELATSSDTKIRKINKVLKETFGFSLVSDIETGKLNTLYTKISDDLYNLKLDLGNAQNAEYMQKVLVLEGLKILIEKKQLDEQLMGGKGGRAYEKVINWLKVAVNDACEKGDEYDEAIYDALKAYRSSMYRFPDDVVEFDLRKETQECAGEMAFTEGLTEGEFEVGAADDPVNNRRGKKIVTLKDIEQAGGEFTGHENEYTGGPGTSTRHDGSDQVRISKMKTMPRASQWWKYSPEEIMGVVYWQKDQLPPPAGEAFDRNWEKVKSQLQAKYPAPEGELEEGGDRHAEHDWVKTMKKDAGIDTQPGYADDLAGGLSLEDPEEQEDDADDFFSYRSKQKRTEMKEGHIKTLRKLLEAETDQAESLIAAKSFSQELQDMVEKLGRLVNENLPAVSEQMRDAYGADVATGFEDQVANTLNSVMDSLRNSKQEIDNSVTTIADGGAPSNDMDEFSDEELGGGFDDAELDLDSDVELDVDAELEVGDEFGGDEAVAGDFDEPLGRAKKESIKVLGKKIVEAKQKLARIKAKVSS